MHKYDLVICGGGTAGVAAAYIAAKLGLKTLVIEKNIHLGGTITSGLVIPAMKSNTQNINCEFYRDFVSEMQNFNASITYSDGNDGWFNPEIAKIVLDKLLDSVNCDILFDSEVTDVKIEKNRVHSINILCKALSLHIESLYFVDATGDANFSSLIKNEFLENKQSEQAMTLRFHVSGINLEKFSDWITTLDGNRDVTTSCVINNQTHLSTAYTWDTSKNWALEPIFRAAIDNGDLKPFDSAYFQLFTIPGMPNTVSLNCPRIHTETSINPLSPYDFSIAMITARQQIWRLYSFMKKYFVGFENSYISNIADMAGIRESRRVSGKKVYTKNDLLSGETYYNPVLHADYPIDIHSTKQDSSTFERLKVDYELPIECLQLDKFDNVFVIGRCLSADFEAQAALRIQRSCFSMGEAIAKHVYKLLNN